MKDVIVLAAGKGSKIFPYNYIRSKTMLKVANTPIIMHNIEILIKHYQPRIYIVTNPGYESELKQCFRKNPLVEIITINNSKGTADSLLKGMEIIQNSRYLVLYGDTLIDEKDLCCLYEYSGAAVLVYPMKESSRNWIGVSLEKGNIGAVGAHYRGNSITHQIGGFSLNEAFKEEVRITPNYFPDLKVGVGPPKERYIEAALSQYIQYKSLKAIEGEGAFFDIDKPWHLLEANSYMIDYKTKDLKSNLLDEGASISDKAIIKGYVHLGKESYIGDNVRIDGNVIVGDHTVIDNGAILQGNICIGSHTLVKNYCQIYEGSTIGDRCIIEHAAEFLGGIMMDKVYCYHYGEFFGVLGTGVDLGAGTVCGTLRFDDGEVVHSIKGRREVPIAYGNATYMGDYCRTGVHTMIMPGCKIGAYSIIGPGVLLNEDLEEHSYIYVKQDLIKEKWSINKYGW